MKDAVEQTSRMDMTARDPKKQGLRLMALGAALMVIYLSVLPLKDQLLIKNKAFYGGGARLIRDDWDRLVGCYSRGLWIRQGGRPYLDAKSEYPPLATVFFGIGHLFTRNSESYMWFHSLMMAGFFLGSLHLMRRILGRFGQSPWMAYPLLLPGFIYFTVNRFDIFPCFAVLLALSFLLQDRWKTSFAVLACATMIKWYPFLLLAPFAGFVLSRHGVRAVIRPALVFVAVLAAINLPIFALGGFDAISHDGAGAHRAVTSFVSGGLNTLLFPYRSQAVGNENIEGMLLFFLWAPRRPVFLTFFALQFTGFALSLLFRARSHRDVVNDSALCIMFFVLFSKVYSPQWLLWYVPFLCIAGTNRDRRKLIAYDLASYMVFAVGFDIFGPGSPPHLILIVVRHVLFFWLLIPRLREMIARSRSGSERDGKV